MERSRTHVCMQLGPARTAHLLASFWATFLVLHLGSFSVGQGIVSCPDQCHIVHISRVHKQLLLILKDARLHFAALIHCTLDPHIPGHVRIRVTSYVLSEVSTKEGNLISTKTSQHSPEIRQLLPIPIIVICYHLWQHGT